jgi:predicted ATP-grasp superfamily ATP-dependent carboligase
MKELEALDPSEFAAAFLKPLNSLKFFKAHGVKALLFRSKDEAIQHAQRFGFPIMLQEFIAGPPTAHYFIDGFVDRSGRTLARFTRQRIRMSPPLFGNSTSTVSIPSERVLPAAESLELLFRELAYHGIFNAEFKYDERDGLFKLLEVNARPWIYVGFAARAGVNVCLMAYRDALGLPVEAVSEFELGRCCVDVLQDLRAFRYGRKQRGESVWSWLKFIISADKISFRWTDPAVALISFISFLKGQFQRRPRLWMRKLTPPLSGPFDVKVQLPTTSDPRLRKAL